MNYNLPPFNEKEKHGFFEQNIFDFSDDLFKNKIFGSALGIILNLIFIYSFFKSKSCLSIVIYIFLVYMVFAIILFKLASLKRNKKETNLKFYSYFNNRDAKEEPISEEKINESFKEFHSSVLYFKNFIKKTISLEDKFYTSKVLIEIYLLLKISSFLGDKIIILIFSNICLFYAPLEKKYPHFMFKCRMSIEQIIEGIIVSIQCIIPRYEEELQEEKIE